MKLQAYVTRYGSYIRGTKDENINLSPIFVVEGMYIMHIGVDTYFKTIVVAEQGLGFFLARVRKELSSELVSVSPTTLRRLHYKLASDVAAVLDERMRDHDFRRGLK